MTTTIYHVEMVIEVNDDTDTASLPSVISARVDNMPLVAVLSVTVEPRDVHAEIQARREREQMAARDAVFAGYRAAR